jgi:predicted proteasome-type protease
MVSSGLLRRVALVRTDVSEEPGASFIRVAKIGALGTTQAVTSNRRTLRRNTHHSSTSAVTSNYSTMRTINHYMRKEAMEWAVLHEGWEEASCNCL